MGSKIVMTRTNYKIFGPIRKRSNENKILKQETIFQEIELLIVSVRKIKNEIRPKEEKEEMYM